ncbi:hypothetical protein Phum_PHUM461840 [Pediculus humanus corporis]|uniref:Uncharacterized protein n=1 Tax=Pediculus humanus subsp. corporis TaxID=121224 RepID=E0VVC9_PEDHC|nr:uncharacterized protein Phum_PHUM461840 [Pediculus humanus corporis]EEB17335.1 hypothetical protein Phum_PHUM461840 [Pediculus humanus corporis]
MLEQKLRTELLLGRPVTDVENFIHLFQTNSKNDLKIFRQYLELFYKTTRNLNYHGVRTV